MTILEQITNEVNKFKKHVLQDEKFRNLIEGSTIVEVAMASMAYIYTCWPLMVGSKIEDKPYAAWPWPLENYKPKDNVNDNIVRAIALLILGLQYHNAREEEKNRV